MDDDFHLFTKRGVVWEALLVLVHIMSKHKISQITKWWGEGKLVKVCYGDKEESLGT